MDTDAYESYVDRYLVRALKVVVLALIAILIYAPQLAAQEIPANARTYLPLLIATQQDYWPDAPMPGIFGAQVHKESCIHAKHPKCWNPRAELKTSREYGFGFGQCTIAYNKHGQERFNCFDELRALDPTMRGWRWEDRYDPKMQLRGMLVKDKIVYDRMAGIPNRVDRMAFTLAGYNGGVAGVLSDRRLCLAQKGCDQRKWFGHVEFTSNKSRTPWQGYGQSAFDINRAYPRAIMFKLRPLYDPYFAGSK
jgi:hypothetical protein